MLTVVKQQLSLFSKNTRIILALNKVDQHPSVIQTDVLASNIKPRNIGQFTLGALVT